MTWVEGVTAKLASDGYDPKFGARPLRRLIQRTVEDTLSEELLQGHVTLGREVRLVLRDDRIALDFPDSGEENREAVPAETETTASAVKNTGEE